MMTLADKVVVVTGAGSGIGRALAVNLARRGSLLALSDVNATGLAETVVVDVGDREQRAAPGHVDGERAADAGPGTGDHDHLVVERLHAITCWESACASSR